MSQLVLGTVQFGLKYGINNKMGKPSREASLKMLDRAYEQGITVFDTAAAYGDAEEILGEFISTRNLKGKIEVISKMLPNIVTKDILDVTKLIREEIIKSTKKMKVDYLNGYLLHTPGYIYNKQVMEALEICKQEELISHYGVSIYEEKDALYAAELDGVEFIQVPYSVFDQRLNKTNFFETSRKNRVKVFGRSVFLQGLLFMNEDEIPEHLAEARGYLNEFKLIIKKFNLNIAEASLLFTYYHNGVDFLVFGIDTLEQLDEDILICHRSNDIKDCIEELKNKFSNIDKSIIFPSLWSKKT